MTSTHAQRLNIIAAQKMAIETILIERGDVIGTIPAHDRNDAEAVKDAFDQMTLVPTPNDAINPSRVAARLRNGRFVLLPPGERLPERQSSHVMQRGVSMTKFSSLAGTPASNRSADAAPNTRAPSPAEAVTPPSFDPPDPGSPPAPDAPQIDASPAAVKFAQEHGVDLSAVTGTGQDGKITKTDVEKHLDESE